MVNVIVVLMDGTWNNSIRQQDADSNDSNPAVIVDENSTNIARIWPLLDKSRQRVIYQRGIGTSGNVLDVPAGAFGKGGETKVDEIINQLQGGPHGWRPGVDLCIFGFSRGAATARLLARRLFERGIAGRRPVPVRFLGLFDTVASMGRPELMAENFTDIRSYHKAFDSMVQELAIPPSVARVAHLVALDEDRSVFAPTLITLDSPGQPTQVDETWFGGNHGDVGGGWPDATEQDHEFRRRMITLRYMLEQPHGLTLASDWKEHPDVQIDPTFARLGTKHGWQDYPLRDRMLGRLARDPQVLHGREQSPVIHPSARR